ncbi:putative actin cross-linking [Lupinus albus]|uniref:Putative actin cross-linking n=1 Tax=Lupinus albus TaxID=3870 RepID=A0A6A4Q1T7_LUPAL|nr:putative actin cross-linking [Lupinus albus]
MEFFHRAKAVRLRSHRDKYLHADEDEESVTLDRNGSSKNAKWIVEFVPEFDNIIRLKSCYGNYLTASNMPFLLGATGRKVLQTLPSRLDSSVEWEPVRDGAQVKLKTRYDNFLRANGGLPPWRNSVTHDVPHRTSSHDWILWDVDVVEIRVDVSADVKKPAAVPHSDSLDSESYTPSAVSINSSTFSRQESIESSVCSPPKMEGRMIYYHVAGDNGEVDDENVESYSLIFKGNGVEELAHRFEEETGLEDVIVCTRSPLNGKLYPLRLQLPPNNVMMHVVLVLPSSKVANDLEEQGLL